MTKKYLMKFTKEKLIIYAFNECGGMELEDEMLKGDMINEILAYDPKPIKVPVKIDLVDIELTQQRPAKAISFEEWFSTHLQEFVDRSGENSPHHPDMHGCIGGNPVCDNCDATLESPMETYAGNY